MHAAGLKRQELFSEILFLEWLFARKENMECQAPRGCLCVAFLLRSIVYKKNVVQPGTVPDFLSGPACYAAG